MVFRFKAGNSTSPGKTCHFQDVSEVPDVEVESVLVKLYAAEASEFITKGCLNLLGLRAAMEESK